MSTATERAERARVNKFDVRRRELAEAALVAIAEHGFAKTGLRDISARTELSTGILHYYFEGKDDLIAQAIWQYKSECARRYDPIVETSQTAEELVARFGVEISAAAGALKDMQRPWSDLRKQARSDHGLRDTTVPIDELLTEMVWAVVKRHAELLGRSVTIDRDTTYALFDGIFLNCLIGYMRGDLAALEQIRTRSANLLAASV